MTAKISLSTATRVAEGLTVTVCSGEPGSMRTPGPGSGTWKEYVSSVSSMASLMIRTGRGVDVFERSSSPLAGSKAKSVPSVAVPLRITPRARREGVALPIKAVGGVAAARFSNTAAVAGRETAVTGSSATMITRPTS